MVWTIVVVALIVLAVVYFVFDPSGSRFFPKCAFHALTGYQCPGCGSQRAIHALLHGHLMEAIRFNALLVFSLPLVVMLLTVKLWRNRLPRLHRFLNSTVITAGTGITIILWWLLRNLLHC